MTHQKIKFFSLALLIFIISPLIWYLPIKYKGSAPTPADRNLILARNLYLTDQYALEDKNGIYLTSSQVEEKGEPDTQSNSLTPQIYHQIYHLFGFSPQLASYITLIIYALINALLFIAVGLTFGLSIGLIFSLTNIFMPLIWQAALIPAFYEWALLFFVIGLICYWAKKSNLFFLFLSSVFFGFSIMSRTAFFIVVGALGLFELIHHKSLKRIVIFSLPILILIIAPFVYQLFQGGSLYLNSSSFDSYGHCFPDPYTFTFDKENYLALTAAGTKNDVLSCFWQYGYRLTLTDHLKMMLDSIKYYLRELFKLISWGGPLIWLIAILGAWELKKRKPEMLKMFYFWSAVWLAGLTILETSNGYHILEIWIPLVLLFSLGLAYLTKLLRNNLEFLKTKKIIIISLILGVLLLIGHFIEADRWMFHEEYSTGRTAENLAVVAAVKKADLGKNDVLAIDTYSMALINYYNDINVIRFSPETLEKLIKENKLKDAFAKFGVTYIVGYDSSINKEITKTTKVKVIKLENF